MASYLCLNFIILSVRKSYRPTVNEHTKHKPIRCELDEDDVQTFIH